MFLFMYLFVLIISLTSISSKSQYYDPNSNNYLYQSVREIYPNVRDYYYTQPQPRMYDASPADGEKVKIQLFYECLCPDCRNFDTQQLAPTVRKLAKHLDIHLYPYGNANTYVYPNGTIEVRCQHGPAECYGNMLHACAIDYLKNITNAVFYNSCMMDYSQNNVGSDDEAADKCAKYMRINSESIKQCAKSDRGLQLLKYYGDESKKVGFKYVPYILINGSENSGSNFMHDVCASFKNPPPECKQKF